MAKAMSKTDRFKMIPDGEEKCIWMAAGVIDYKLCNNHYNCYTCAFDKGMKEAAERSAEARSGGRSTGKTNIVAWRDKMKQQPGPGRICRHALTGRTPLRTCPYSYECYHCPFDQMLEDCLELALPCHIVTMNEIEGYRVPDGHFFHPGHAWARVEARGRIRIGIDDFSTRVFGKADEFDLPLTGDEVKASEVGFTFKKRGNEACVLSPVRGIVVATNRLAAKEPEVVKAEPYNEGWLLVVEPLELKTGLKKLMYGKQTADWIEAEHKKLMGLASEVGATLVDGGTIEDAAENLPNLDWKALTREFLHT